MLTLSPSISSIVADAIERRIFPGAVVLVHKQGLRQHLAAYGSTMYDDAGSQPAAPSTIYDVASLTKVFTATAALRLFDAGLLALEAPVRRYLPAVRAHGVSIQHLLTHTSGLDMRLSVLRERGAAGLRAAVYAAEPLRPPGSYVAYTNINTLLLGDAVAHVYGGTLETAMQELLLGPLELNETGFTPPARLLPRIAPSEWDSEWRGGLVHGSVHDESAATLGGVAGHAGLFSTAADLERFAQLWLEGGSFEGKQLLREATVGLALRDYTDGLPSPVAGQRYRGGLGWMLDRPAFMGRAPAGSYGHTGFTGPVLVLVPQRQLAVIVLSNRTYPRRTPPPYPHHAITAAIVNAALD
ncbi:MAG: beta-lactamase family protein [Chloroflexaceae bacterium]|jgi:CubicO group peptidase (beta-lactamase class C family)|nr:beta-lactamase family protein [Chloroflexaceae bacterium]